MSRPVIFVDLDDTLFQTRRKCPADVAERLQTMAVDRDGRPLSFATPRQQHFLAWLTSAAQVVPVTARSQEALRRVHLPPGPAICAHGGVILGEDGLPDAAWAAAIADEARRHEAALTRLAAAAAAAAPADVRVRVLGELGTDLYVLIKPVDHEDAAGLAELVTMLGPLIPPDWTVHRNDAVAAFLPPFLGKARAVERLLAAIRRDAPDTPAIGIGDSFTDAAFMALCDYAAAPTGSQLAGRLLAMAGP
jgi:hydroxymethylpyrimidine pyrophosphatase-like HAD family hydrolase